MTKTVYPISTALGAAATAVAVDSQKYAKWLLDDIPHRIRAGVVRQPILERLLAGIPNEDEKRIIRDRGEGNALWDGRLNAIRWLIDFIGIRQDKNGNAISTASCAPQAFDFHISDVGAPLMDHTTQDAHFLAGIWRGCSRGASHPTDESQHEDVSEKQIEKAMDLIVAYLDKELYSKAGTSVASESMKPPPPQPAPPSVP